MNKIIRVFEHDKLTIYKNEYGNKLSINQLQKLYDFNDKNQNKYFTGIRDGIKFNQYVGIIQIGNQTIEILPKADKENNFDLWRNVLLHMLKYCRKIDMESISDADLKRKNNSLLELYYYRFITLVQQLIHQGLIKKYNFETSNSTALKGQIIFTKQISKNLIHQERFYTKHQIYNHNHLLNQIILKAINILLKLVSNSNLKSSLEAILFQLPVINETVITLNDFEKIKYTKKNIHYREAIQIAKMIILNYSPDIKSGSENMIALLFDMNKLWEEFIFKILLNTNNPDFILEEQQQKLFWEFRTIRPDIVITNKKSKAKFIIDTKWKNIESNSPNIEDLKQMYVYNEYWSSTASMLLYPNTKNQKDITGKYHYSNNEISNCKISFVNLVENNSLNLNIGNEIFAKLYD